MKKILLFVAATLMAVSASAANITSWTIAGDEILLGSKWDPADTDNDMTLIAGAYMLEIRAYLTEGGYDYKACANHAWGIQEVPATGNQTLVIDADGDYIVTFSMDASGTSLGAFAELDTAVKEVKAEASSTTKVIENGVIYIYKNGAKYNLLGVPVK